MTSWRNEDFKKAFAKLPPEIQDLTDATYELWKASPFHPSLHFKHLDNDIWSVRIGRGHRAMGIKIENDIVWFWIGTHAAYDALYGETKTLKKGQTMQQQRSKSNSPKPQETPQPKTSTKRKT